MGILDVLDAAVRRAIGVDRVFGDPIERDGVTLIPAAAIGGGGGGGGGQDAEGQSGEGGGFGLRGRPSGAFVISEGRAGWRPALDVNRLVAALAVVGVVYLLTRVRLERLRQDAAGR